MNKHNKPADAPTVSLGRRGDPAKAYYSEKRYVCDGTIVIEKTWHSRENGNELADGDPDAGSRYWGLHMLAIQRQLPGGRVETVRHMFEFPFPDDTCGEWECFRRWDEVVAVAAQEEVRKLEEKENDARRKSAVALTDSRGRKLN